MLGTKPHGHISLAGECTDDPVHVVVAAQHVGPDPVAELFLQLGDNHNITFVYHDTLRMVHSKTVPVWEVGAEGGFVVSFDKLTSGEIRAPWGGAAGHHASLGLAGRNLRIVRVVASVRDKPRVWPLASESFGPS